MDKPKLSPHQYAVGQAELKTGHILKNNKSLFLVGDDNNDAYQIFNFYEQAKEFSITRVNDNPDIECWIYDHTGQVTFGYDKHGERNIPPITSFDK